MRFKPGQVFVESHSIRIIFKVSRKLFNTYVWYIQFPTDNSWEPKLSVFDAAWVTQCIEDSGAKEVTP